MRRRPSGRLNWDQPLGLPRAGYRVAQLGHADIVAPQIRLSAASGLEGGAFSGVAHGTQRVVAGVRDRRVELRLVGVFPDPYYEGMGLNAWSIDPALLGVPFLHSALEGRWGGAAVLADQLIVPLDHPIVGDDGRVDRLVRDLQDITRAFREANGLPLEGESIPATARSVR